MSLFTFVTYKIGVPYHPLILRRHHEVNTRYDKIDTWRYFVKVVFSKMFTLYFLIL